jgi:Rad3-related DNA helicase
VDLTDSIVIVDEGHNLIDAVNAVHSATVSLGQLTTAKAALDTYFTRFSNRLAPGMYSVLSMFSAVLLSVQLSLLLEQDNIPDAI